MNIKKREKTGWEKIYTSKLTLSFEDVLAGKSGHCNEIEVLPPNSLDVSDEFVKIPLNNFVKIEQYDGIYAKFEIADSDSSKILLSITQYFYTSMLMNNYEDHSRRILRNIDTGKFNFWYKKSNIVIADDYVEIKLNDFRENYTPWQGETPAVDRWYTATEAAQIWGLDSSTVKKACQNERFEEDEFRKSAGTWLVSSRGMNRLYGDIK